MGCAPRWMPSCRLRCADARCCTRARRSQVLQSLVVWRLFPLRQISAWVPKQGRYSAWAAPWPRRPWCGGIPVGATPAHLAPRAPHHHRRHVAVGAAVLRVEGQQLPDLWVVGCMGSKAGRAGWKGGRVQYTPACCTAPCGRQSRPSGSSVIQQRGPTAYGRVAPVRTAVTRRGCLLGPCTDAHARQADCRRDARHGGGHLRPGRYPH